MSFLKLKKKKFKVLSFPQGTADKNHHQKHRFLLILPKLYFFWGGGEETPKKLQPFTNMVGELVEFEDGTVGIALNLEEENVSAVLLVENRSSDALSLCFQ